MRLAFLSCCRIFLHCFSFYPQNLKKVHLIIYLFVLANWRIQNTVQLSRIFGVMSSRTCNYIPMCCWRVPWLKSNSLSQRRKNWSETKTSSLGNKAIIYKLPQYYQNFSLENAYRTEYLQNRKIFIGKLFSILLIICFEKY